MRENILKKKIHKGERVTGVIISAFEPNLVEISAMAGFDFVFIDCEHGMFTLAECQTLVRTCESAGITSMIRSEEPSEARIKQYLETGVQGIVLTGVNEKKDAEKIVYYSRYYPMGQRGLSVSRAASYGFGMPLSQYVDYANENLLVSVLIESDEAVKNVQDILGVEGIDFGIVGQGDLSQNLGHPGNKMHPDVWPLIKEAISEGRKIKPMGGITGGPTEDAATYYDLGCQIALTGAYDLYMGNCKKFIEEANKY